MCNGVMFLHRVYCGICIERLCGREELERVQQAETWECYLCSHEHAKLGLLCKRDNWLDMLKELFSNDYEVEYVRHHIPSGRTKIETPITNL